MSLILSDQDDVLKQAVARARIPHGQKVRVRIPDVEVAGTRGNPVLKFCSVSRVEVLDPLPPQLPGMSPEELDELDLEVSDPSKCARPAYEFRDAHANLEINGRMNLEVTKLVPCGAA